MSINFCHIAPTPHLADLTKTNGAHLLLAHLVEKDEQYTQYYNQLDDNKVKILDNSAFEMYKQGLPMYPSDKLIEMGKRVKADYVVMSDYPNEPSLKTIKAAIALSPLFHDAGFGTFFVPQSQIGDLEDYISCFEWATDNPATVDYIGVSILGVPNAFGVERGNKLQRYLARWHMMNILYDRGILQRVLLNKQKIHFLGMVDGPNEIDLMREYHRFIDTWDSSSAVWLGLHGKQMYDTSPTGIVGGKYEVEVDFDFVGDTVGLNLAKSNIQFVDRMCGYGI